MARNPIDKPFLFTTIALVVLGFFTFSSASLGLLAREGARFSQVALTQIVFGILLGGIALIVLSQINYRVFKKYALVLFIISIVLTLLVFVPGLGFTHNGATRWLILGSFSFQPAELLKLGFVLYFATWLSGARQQLGQFKYGLLPLLGLLALVGTILLMQPDTGTFLVIVATAGAMFIAGGGKFRDVALLGGIGVAALGLLAYVRPYIKERILTFLDPSIDPLGLSYQIQQSLIAIGSGGWFGRGYGQSVQKFDYLPEPIGDSIFAVIAEEFGFVGGIVLLTLFLFLAFRGLRIAARSPDLFGGLVVVGIVILITSQSFINVASMVGVLPLTGLPLVFVSHGGSALFMALLEIGIILNVSRYARL
jgi:cell division protein FtsW